MYTNWTVCIATTKISHATRVVTNVKKDIYIMTIQSFDFITNVNPWYISPVQIIVKHFKIIKFYYYFFPSRRILEVHTSPGPKLQWQMHVNTFSGQLVSWSCLKEKHVWYSYASICTCIGLSIRTQIPIISHDLTLYFLITSTTISLLHGLYLLYTNQNLYENTQICSFWNPSLVLTKVWQWNQHTSTFLICSELHHITQHKIHCTYIYNTC